MITFFGIILIGDIMILNVSGRTDIVAFYSKWFINRYRQGFVDVRNPFNPNLVSRIYFEDVEAILFCTKNPIPILDYLNEIKKTMIFHVTLTSYNKDIEPGINSKKDIIEAIKKLSSIVGIDNLYVRYDPIFLSDKYNLEYHIKAFDKMCSLLNGYVRHIIISFLDDYKNVKKNINVINYRNFKENDYREIGINFSEIANKYQMSIQTCYEANDLVEYGFKKDVCLSIELAYKLTGKVNYKKWKARGCGCVEMVDIGVYNSCKHFCKYCYANYDEKIVNNNYELHDPNSSLLIGKLKSDDIIKIRRK